MRDYIIENACALLVRKTLQLINHPSQHAAQFWHSYAGDQYVVTVMKVPKEEQAVA